MTNSSIRVLALTTFGLLLSVEQSNAQQIRSRPSPWADSTPARIMSLVAKGFPTDVVVDVLRQRYGNYPLSKRRALADSATTFIIRRPDPSTLAIAAISMAGSNEPGLKGTPDPEMLQQLIRIHREARNEETRRAALSSLPDQVNPERALPYLREVAISSLFPDAMLAVARMGRLATNPNLSATAAPRAQAVLRELYDKNLVKIRPADMALCDFAEHEKWPPANRCRGRA